MADERRLYPRGRRVNHGGTSVAEVAKQISERRPRLSLIAGNIETAPRFWVAVLVGPEFRMLCTRVFRCDASEEDAQRLAVQHLGHVRGVDLWVEPLEDWAAFEAECTQQEWDMFDELGIRFSPLLRRVA